MMVEESFLERLLSLKGDMSEAAFAKRVGIPATTLKNYYHGSMPSLDKAAQIASAFDQSIDWLWGDGGTSLSAASDDLIAIPRYEIQASAGSGSVVLSEEVADYFNVSRDWIARFAPAGARLGMIEARGDSMEPTIRDGDALVISFDIDERAVAAGGVFVVGISGNLLVKRLQLMSDGSVRVSSDNRNYEPEILTKEEGDDRLTINARVLFAVAPLR